MLMGNGGNSLLPMEKINHQIMIIRDNESLENQMRYCNIEWKNRRYDSENPQIEFDFTVPPEQAEYRILHMPQLKYKNLDIGGVDTYFKSDGKRTTAKPGTPREKSDGAMYIFRRDNILDSSMFSNGPVAEYTARYPTTDLFYEGCLKLAVAYNCLMLSENDEAFRIWMEGRNALRFFKSRPTAFDTINTESSQAYMVHMSPEMKRIMTGLLVDYLERYTKNIGFIRLLENFKWFGIKNTDLASAFGICLIFKQDIWKVEVKDLSREEKEVTDFPTYERNRSGIIVPTFQIEKQWDQTPFKTW
jgi:hypothetical protein